MGKLTAISRGRPPAKQDLILIDIVDNTSKHRLVNLNALFDLPEQLDLKGQSAVEVLDTLERLSREASWMIAYRLAPGSV